MVMKQIGRVVRRINVVAKAATNPVFYRILRIRRVNTVSALVRAARDTMYN